MTKLETYRLSYFNELITINVKKGLITLLANLHAMGAFDFELYRANMVGYFTVSRECQLNKKAPIFW